MNKSCEIKNLNIILENEVYEYRIIFSNRRSIEIKLKHDGQICVSAPFYVTLKEIESLLLKKSGWLIEKVAFLKKQYKADNIGITEHTTIPLNGCDIDFRIISLEIKRPQLIFNTNCLTIQMPIGFKDADRNILISEILRNFYKKNTQNYLRLRVGFFEDLIGVQALNIAVRDQKSRWGSCSGKKNLNFNLRLSMTPKFVFDYVIVHELCHLIEMNHSKKFWLLVGRVYPDFEKAKVWLSQNGHKLMFI